MAGMAGLVSATGCGSLRQPEPLSGWVQPPTEDAGRPQPESPPDASSLTSPDARTVDPLRAGADAGRGDAAVTSAGPDAGPSGGGTPDGGAADAATVVSPLASTVVAQNVGTIDALAIDGATLYGLTTDNALWMLEPGSTAPQLLAQDATPVGFSCGHDSRLALTASDLFWLARSTDTTNDLLTGLHRTARSGSGDTLIATGVAYSPYPMVAADDTRVYWIDGADTSDGGRAGLIRTLPVDAAPGMTPTTLVADNGGYDISAITLAGPTLYWVSTYQYTTVFQPGLFKEAVTDLFAAHPPAPTPLGESWFVQPHGSDLYIEVIRDLWHQNLARRSSGGSTVSLAPIGGPADSIVFVDDWALLSIPSDSCGDYRHQLVAVPTATPGGAVVQLADDLSTPAVLGTELAFVDLVGQVHTSTLDQVRAALTTSRGFAF